MAHGVLPVPAPATAALLKGKPTYSNGVQRELVTPTGAAIVATLCDSFGPQPPMTVSAIGYGAGTADLEGQPNVVRIMIGHPAEKLVAGFDEEISVIEANLDDMNPQIYGYFLEKALAAGALDVYTTPVQMKKNRPGTLLDRPLQTARRQRTHNSDLRGDNNLRRAHHHRAAPHLAARTRQRLHNLRRRPHQTDLASTAASSTPPPNSTTAANSP